jgi:hypothetical protein
MRRPLLITGIALVLALAALAVIGRSERRHWIDTQIRGMKRTRAAIGPLDSPTLIGYRVLPEFDCLVYRRSRDPYALELCVDGAGRVVQTIDRRRGRVYYTLQAQPSASTFRVDEATVKRLLAKMGAFR